MGDLTRTDQSEVAEIIGGRPDLQLKQMKILLSEKESQLDGIVVAINKLKTVEMQKLELSQDIIQEQIKKIRENIIGIAKGIGGETEKTIDAEFTVVSE